MAKATISKRRGPSAGSPPAPTPIVLPPAPVENATPSVPGGTGADEQFPLAPFEMMDAPALDVRLTGARIETQSLVFDPEWYIWRYSDIEAAGVDPVQHYFSDGAREGRDPNRYFNTTWYVQSNPDVLASGTNPFLHYLLYGAREGRKPRP